MDTSEQYIKMCEKAEEIQSQRPDVDREDNEFRHIANDGDYTWLPRQDQLQEILGTTRVNRIEGFNAFCGTIVNGIWFIKPEFFDSTMEQRWLAFVMKEKYNKTWNGEYWEGIKIEPTGKGGDKSENR